MKTIIYEDYELGFSRETYVNNNNLAIQIWCVEDNCFVEPFAMLTVNLGVPCKENRAFIDNNNCPRNLIDLLIDKGYMNCTFRFERSGFCEYYEYVFSDEFLQNVVA